MPFSRLGARHEGVAPITLAASTTLNARQHGDVLIRANNAAGFTITLPAATGSGVRFRIAIVATITSNALLIKVTGNDILVGQLIAVDTDAATTLRHHKAAAASDTISLDGTATGGKAGDIIELEDWAADQWLVRGEIGQSGGSEATPFAETVTP